MMRMTLRTMSLIAALCTAAAARAQFSPAVATVVNADRTVTFQLEAPDASSVLVQFANGFEGAKRTPLVKNAAGVWSATLGPFAPDLYEYSFVVNGVVTADPGNGQPKPQRFVNTSLLAIQGNPLVDDQAVPHGAIHEEIINSKVMKAPRLTLVYTPPGYKRMANLPVLVLYHGAGDTTYSWVRQGRIAQIMDNMIAHRTVMPMVVLVVETYPVQVADADLLARSTQQAVDEELFTDILPFVERRYRVKRGSNCRAIAGLSMGGGQTVYTALTHPEAFSAVGLLSPAYIGDLPSVDAQRANAAFERFDVVTGTGDFILSLQELLDQALTTAGITHTYTKVSGADHSMFLWRPALRDFVEALTADHAAGRWCARGQGHFGG